jgi:hypothetical protein
MITAVNLCWDMATNGIEAYSTDQGQGANVNIKGKNNKVNIEQGQQSPSSGGGGGGSYASMSECRAFCSNIG